MEIGVQVESYAGHRGEQEPRRLWFGRRAVPVSEIVDRWPAPDHQYFKLRGEDGATYILRHDHSARRWELVKYQRAGCQRLS